MNEQPKNSIPKGTTQEQWDKYEQDCKEHEEHIKRYRFFLDRICNMLEFKKPNHFWTTAHIHNVMTAEIDMSSSCDAPNKPGYYRANND